MWGEDQCCYEILSLEFLFDRINEHINLKNICSYGMF